ncbi:hypothetical protein [Alkalimarinus alittae]|uniref:Uncharacterized protein n=1 Tax=Alkalimarinus alittae TaxID=2961619 RepID=A0ABY6MYU3_9ALTE|nr:hypothetical protein [Alkalimarinus alittae]UZE95013.1 hypothetical protein NKI27_13165 [Alkalimarinus alittae]
MKDTVDHKIALEAIITRHFSEARERVDKVCAAQFFSATAVVQRHWENRKDIPQDIAAVPRAGWGLAKKLAGKGHASTRVPSGKEQALLTIVTQDLLQLDSLSSKLNDYLEFQVEDAGLTTQTLSSLLDKRNAPLVETWLKHRIETHSVAQEGVRESLVFIATGLVGRAISDKAVFGSSMGLGSMAATSIYLSQQGWWSGLMVQIFGVPGWVSVAGMMGGVVATLAVMPVLSPLVETGVNRFRAQRMLTRIVDSVERDMMKESPEVAGIAGRLATFIGLLPDLLHIAAKLRN